MKFKNYYLMEMPHIKTKHIKYDFEMEDDNWYEKLISKLNDKYAGELIKSLFDNDIAKRIFDIKVKKLDKKKAKILIDKIKKIQTKEQLDKLY